MKPPKLEWRETKRAYLLGLTLTIIDLVVGLVALLWGGVGKAAQALFHPTVWTAVGVCCWVLWRKRPASLDSDVAVEAFSERARGFAFWGLVLTLSIYVPACVWYYSTSIHLVTPTPEGKIGIVLADFGEGPEFKSSVEGAEIRGALEHTLRVRLAEIGLGERVFVQSVGLIGDERTAAVQGEKAGASIVVWGWHPADGEGLVPHILMTDTREVAQLLSKFEKEPLMPLLGIDEALGQGGPVIVGGKLGDRTAVLAAFVIGILYMSDSEYDEAASELTDAISIAERIGGQEPYVSTLYAVRGAAWLSMGSTEDATSDFETATQVNRCEVLALVGLGNIFYTQGQMRAAHEQYELAVNCDPSSYRAKIGLGNALFYLGRPYEALAKLKEAIGLNQSCTVAYYNIAVVYSYLGDRAGAKQALNECIARCASDEQLRSKAERLLGSIVDTGGGVGPEPGTGSPSASGTWGTFLTTPSVPQLLTATGRAGQPPLAPPSATSTPPRLATRTGIAAWGSLLTPLPAYEFVIVHGPVTAPNCETVYLSGRVIGAEGDPLDGVTIRLRAPGDVMYYVTGQPLELPGTWTFVPLGEDQYHSPSGFMLDIVISEEDPRPLSSWVSIAFTDCAVAGEFTGLTFEYAW